MDPIARDAAWRKLTIPNVDDLEYREGLFWLRIQADRLPATSGMRATVDSQQDATPRDFYNLTNNGGSADYLWWCAVVQHGSPFSPFFPVLAIEYCGDKDEGSHVFFVPFVIFVVNPFPAV
jgi:hypothetical protein